MSKQSALASETDNPVCDVRFGQVGLANIRIMNAAPELLREELAQRVASAPALFERTAVVMDLSHLDHQPDDARVSDLLDAIRTAGMLPVGLAYGSNAMDELGRRLGLPLIARFRDAYERNQSKPVAAADSGNSTPQDPPGQTGAHDSATLIHTRQVRSGQQMYAQQRDLVITAAVANSAEVISDGSIHVYGSLRGRALAGAQGEESARIFCTDFHAQLVSIAGRYRVFEEIPEQYEGQAVQCWLENDKLRIAVL